LIWPVGGKNSGELCIEPAIKAFLMLGIDALKRNSDLSMLIVPHDCANRWDGELSIS
jgi:hypothetical protein